MAKLYFNKEIGLVATKRDLKGLDDMQIWEKGWENINKDYNSKHLVLYVKKTEQDLYKIKITSNKNDLREFLIKDNYKLIKEANSNDIDINYRYMRD